MNDVLNDLNVAKQKQNDLEQSYKVIFDKLNEERERLIEAYKQLQTLSPSHVSPFSVTPVVSAVVAKTKSGRNAKGESRRKLIESLPLTEGVSASQLINKVEGILTKSTVHNLLCSLSNSGDIVDGYKVKRFTKDQHSCQFYIKEKVA